MSGTNLPSHIDVFIGNNNGIPSFNPLDSDGTNNAIHVEQMVGTLVRMHPSGRYEGYLAQSWSNAPDFKEWKFNLKENLKCEDGTAITAQTYVESLHKVLKLFKEHSELPLIDRLLGFSDLKKTGKIIGLQGKGLTLSFKFSTPVESGLLEYLALPFLGFYCESNFNEDGTWKSDSRLVSSGAYQLDGWKGIGPVKLKLRANSVRFVPNPPETLTISSHDPNQINAPSTRTFIFSYLLERHQIPEKFNVVNMIPTIFNGIMISPERSKWLNDERNRYVLRDAIKTEQKEVGHKIEGAVPIDHFYPHLSQQDAKLATHSGAFTPPEEPLLILMAEKPTVLAKYQLEVLKRALENVNIPFEVKYMRAGQKGMMQNHRDKRNFDLRPIGVNIGGGIENQLIKFMFCSKLGISFSDPKNDVCKLVEEFENRFGDVVPQEAMREYIERFDAYVWRDATIVPVIKTGHAWLLSPDLPLDIVNPTMDTPYFDLFNLK